MGSAGSRPSRALRAAMFAALCVLLAATGHIHSSGVPLPWWALVVALPATGGVAWFLTGRERGVPVVVSATVVAQSVLHVVFSLTVAVAASAGSEPLADRWWGQLRRALAGGLVPPGPAAGEAPHAAHMAQAAHEAHASPGSGMVAAHLAAALLSGLWLAHGERAVFRIARLLGARLVAPLRLFHRLPCPEWPARPTGAVDHRRPRRSPVLHVVTTRGPPPGTAVA